MSKRARNTGELRIKERNRSVHACMLITRAHIKVDVGSIQTSHLLKCLKYAFCCLALMLNNPILLFLQLLPLLFQYIILCVHISDCLYCDSSHFFQSGSSFLETTICCCHVQILPCREHSSIVHGYTRTHAHAHNQTVKRARARACRHTHSHSHTEVQPHAHRQQNKYPCSIHTLSHRFAFSPVPRFVSIDLFVRDWIRNSRPRSSRETSKTCRRGLSKDAAPEQGRLVRLPLT